MNKLLLTKKKTNKKQHWYTGTSTRRGTGVGTSTGKGTGTGAVQCSTTKQSRVHFLSLLYVNKTDAVGKWNRRNTFMDIGTNENIFVVKLSFLVAFFGSLQNSRKLKNIFIAFLETLRVFIIASLSWCIPTCYRAKSKTRHFTFFESNRQSLLHKRKWSFRALHFILINRRVCFA